MADPGPLKRPLYDKNHGGPSEPGEDVKAIKRALARAGYWKWDPENYSGEYTTAFAQGSSSGPGVKGFQKSRNIQATGNYGQATHDALRKANVPAESPNAGQDAFDGYAADQYRNYRVPKDVPDLGPVFSGGKSVLNQDLTHATSGIPLYPAFDDAFAEGVTIIAPEDLEVVRDSSSNPGDAFYALGKSGLQWWFGHLVSAPKVGTKITKGKALGKTCPNNVGGGPHVHVGINVEKIWGAGKQMAHHTNYTHGGPLVGTQLEAGHPL
jgi:peptidoglycan hydrolase-like protein with peptidoglycan-binding domain